MIKLAAAVLGLTLISGAASADEVWTTPFGEFVYLSEVGDTAVFSYPLEGGAEGHLYIPGLAGNFENRGVHEAYWIDPGKGGCGTVLRGPDQVQSTNWGRAKLIFHTPAFPSAWTLLYGNCFADPSVPIVGTPKEPGTP